MGDRRNTPLPTELHLYDFDGTLFRSPDRPDWWGPSTWFATSISMSPPCVPAKPGSEWWIGRTVSDAKASLSKSDVWTIMCTGRQLGSGLRYRVPELLKQKGLHFNEVLMNPGGDTKSFKIKVIQQMLRKYPEIHTVQIWEDTNLSAFCKAVESMGRVCIPHPVKVKAMEPLCTLVDIEQLEAEGWSRKHSSAERVAARFFRGNSGEDYVSAQLTTMARAKLLRAFPAVHNDVRADHMTIWYDPPSELIEGFNFGRKVRLKVIGYAEDDKGQAVVVSTRLPIKGRVPHITISVPSGGKAAYSNQLLEKGYTKITGPTLDATLTIQH